MIHDIISPVKGDFFMKKIIYPIVYLVLSLLFAYVYPFLYQNFFRELPWQERIAMLQLVSGIIGLVIPVFLFVVFYAFRKTKILLLAISVISVFATFFNIAYTWSQYTMPTLITIPLFVVANFLVFGVIVSWFVLWFMEQESKLVKQSFLIVGIMRFVAFLFQNQLSTNLVFRVLYSEEYINIYFIVMRGISFLNAIALAFVIFALYKNKEDKQINSEIDTYQFVDPTSYEGLE